MTKKIVGMISSYPNLEQGDWLWQQTPEPLGAWQNIQMASQAEHPDFLLLYNFNQFPVLPPKKIFSLSYSRHQKRYAQEMELLETKLKGVPPERVIFLWREPPLDEVVARTINTYDRAKPYCGYISGADDYAPQPDYMPAIWYHSNSFRELADLPPPAKVKPCSWITSGVSRTANHQQRLSFLRSVQAAPVDCDIYGLNLPLWVKSQGELKNKWHGMAPYYYNLAIENFTSNDWYVSEKLWDALLAWCLPIYYGGSAADKLLPKESFLRLPSPDAQGLAYIKEVTANPDLWQERKEAIAEARQIILHKLNLMSWLHQFINKYD